MLKIYFRNYYKFLKKYHQTTNKVYLFTFDQKKLSNNDIKTSVLPCPVKVNISKKKIIIKKNLIFLCLVFQFHKICR